MASFFLSRNMASPSRLARFHPFSHVLCAACRQDDADDDSSRDCFSSVSIRTVERRRPAPKRAPFKDIAYVALIARRITDRHAGAIRSSGPEWGPEAPDPGEIISDW